MIYVDFDKNGSEPLYVQAFNQIALKIRTGGLASGTKLPSQRQLAKQLGVSINTVVNAYNLLARYGYITCSERRGYFVNDVSAAKDVHAPRRWHNNVPSVYNFSKNGVELKMSEDFKKTFRQEIKLFTDSNFTYPDYTGDYDFRKQICSMLRKTQGIECSPTQVVIGAGIEYLLDSLIRVMGHDLVYGFENPAYYKIANFMRIGAEKTKYINIDEHGITSKLLENFDADVLFLMPFHHYPVSYVMTKEQKQAVLGWAGSKRFIVEYGLDMDFIYSGASAPMYSMTDKNNVIFAGDFRKSIAPGINVAYLILPESLVKRWQELYLPYHSFSSQLEQGFINECIKNGSYSRNVRRLYKTYLNRRDTLISSIKAHPIGYKIDVINPDGGTFLLIKPKTSCPEDELIDEAHVAGVKLAYIKNALQQPNDLISSHLFILGFGELCAEDISNGMKLLLDTWEPML